MNLYKAISGLVLKFYEQLEFNFGNKRASVILSGLTNSVSQKKYLTAYDERICTIAHDEGCHHP